MRILITLSLTLLLASVALADTATADFEGGINFGNWTFHGWSEGIHPTGGNPDGWFASEYYWAFWPILECENGAANFTGNYVDMGVNHLSGDFITASCENDGANYNPFTVLLRNDMGTADIEDDLYVYPDPFANLIPQIGEGWTHYDFVIPSTFVGEAGELPVGWMGGSYWTGGDIFPSDRFFQEVVTNVTTVEFHWNHPAFFSFDTGWEVGGDNITIETDGGVATQNTTLSELKSLFR